MNLYKRNNGIYYIKYINEDGREIRLSTKSRKKREALSFLTKFNSSKLVKTTISQVSLSKTKDNYLLYCKQRYSKKYYNIMKSTLDAFSIYVDSVEISAITTEQCEQFILKNYSNAKFMSHLTYRNLRTFFNWVIKQSLIIVSPISKIKPPKVPTKNPEWLREMDLYLILEHIEKKDLRDLLRVLFYTGLRANELLALSWDYINLESRIIIIRDNEGFITKTHHERKIPISNKVYKILMQKSIKNRVGLLFSNSGVKFNVDYISKKFKKALRETDLNQRLHLHSLRHSFASNLVASGASLYLVSKLLGHTRISTTEKYSHVRIDDLRETTELI